MRTTIFLSSFCLLLTACAPSQTTIKRENANPLTASRFGDELADTLANLIITDDPILEKKGMRETINRGIADAKEIASDARLTATEGRMGTFLGINQDVNGFGLLTEDTLYLSSDFATDPGLSLRVYLTELVDPREGGFPDDTTIDLGEIQSVYGAQAYALPKDAATDKLRTLVIWDTVLRRLYGFAQLDN